MSSKENKKFVRRNKFKRYLLMIIILIFVSAMSVGGIYYYNYSNLKKEITIELGTTNISLQDFFQRKVPQDAQFKTDIKALDLNRITDYDIVIQIGQKTRQSKLHIIDTTAPKVAFQDVTAYLDYEFKKEDFIVSIDDFSATNIEAKNVPEDLDLGIYTIDFLVKDSAGNVTEKTSNLIIGEIKPVYELELGDTLKRTDLVYERKNAEAISSSEIKKINQSGVGEYILKTTLNEREYETKIIVKDTKAPTLSVTSATVYDDAKEVDVNDFVKKVTDASDVTLNMKADITYGQIGKYDVTIEAIDKYNNKTSKTTYLRIKKDTDAPVISGLSTIKINKGENADYLKGVKASDKKDGAVEVKITNNAVNNNVAGTYYVTYQAKDKAGNKATKKREVIVRHDAQDLKNKIKEVASNIGNSPAAITEYVNAHMHNANTWGDDDAVWYGLTNWRGNCYVHASVVKALMEAKGYEAKLTNAVGKGHYWVIANINGNWLHYDSVSAYKLIGGTEEERNTTLKGRFTWDKPSWIA